MMNGETRATAGEGGELRGKSNCCAEWRMRVVKMGRQTGKQGMILWYKETKVSSSKYMRR